MRHPPEGGMERAAETCVNGSEEDEMVSGPWRGRERPLCLPACLPLLGQWEAAAGAPGPFPVHLGNPGPRRLQGFPVLPRRL